jgi:glycosyltransferase involved in cell wall biosynthesis
VAPGKKMKTLWLFNQYASTPDQAGGSRHYAMGRILAARGYRVTLFAAGFNYQKREELKCTGKEDFMIEIHDGVRFVWIRTLPYRKNNWKRVINMLSYSWRCLRLYKRLLKENQVEEPDVVIGSAVHLFAVWTAYRVAKKLKTRFVMEVRDLWPMTLVEFRKILKFHPLVIFFGILDRFLAKRAEKIVNVLPGSYDYYKRFGIPRDKVVWIPNGVDTRLYRLEHKEKTKTAGEAGMPFNVMYTGTFGMEANLQTLLRAAKILQDRDLAVSFEIIGSGEKKEELVRLKDRLELKNTAFREPVSKEEIPALLAGADAFWIGTRKVKNLYRYGFSFNKLFEYLAAGKPILFSINSAYNPVEEAGAGLTLPPEDPEALAQAIIRLYHLPAAERLNLGEKGVAYAQQFHEMERLADGFEQLISGL